MEKTKKATKIKKNKNANEVSNYKVKVNSTSSDTKYTISSKGTSQSDIEWDNVPTAEPDSEQGVSDYHSWNRLGRGQSSWCAVFLIALVIITVIMMITHHPANDMFKECLI